MNITIFLANPPPGAASWSPMLNEKKNGHYFTHWKWEFPLSSVFEVEIENPSVHWCVLLHASNGEVMARQDIYPDFNITDGIYAYEWYHNRLTKTNHVPPELIRQTRYWLTVAHGKTPEELEDQIGPYEAADRWRFTISTNAPSTVLKAFLWLSYPQWWVFKQAVKSQGGEVEKIEVVNKEIRIHIRASPLAFLALLVALKPLIILIVGAVTAVLVAFVIRDIIVQKELTEQTYYAYKTAETYEDVINYITSPSVWVCQECGYEMYYEPEVCPQCGSVNIKREGGLGITDPEALELFIDAFPDSTPETDEERWYEKYIRYALIGGGIILGAALIVPQVIRAITRRGKTE